MRNVSDQLKTERCGPSDRSERSPDVGRMMFLPGQAVILLPLLLLHLATAVIFVPSDVYLPNLPTSVSDATRAVTGEGIAPDSRRLIPNSSEQGTISSSPAAINDKYFDTLDSDFQFDTEMNSLTSFELETEANNVKGRLRSHLSFWQFIEASPFVLEIIEHGYSIPFVSKPPRKFNKNNRSALENSDFVSEAVSDLLNKGCIALVSECPEVVSPLSVAFNRSGKKRLILDLHEVNLHVWKSKVKFEDFKVAFTYFKSNNFMFKFDLKSGYHHIDMAEWCRTYLGFSWGEKLYVFTVLQLDLSSCPYVFTKTWSSDSIIS